jgi:hypothetical protein
MKLSMLPSFLDISPNLRHLLDVNLARNDLFNGAQVFGVSGDNKVYLMSLSLCVFAFSLSFSPLLFTTVRVFLWSDPGWLLFCGVDRSWRSSSG